MKLLIKGFLFLFVAGILFVGCAEKKSKNEQTKKQQTKKPNFLFVLVDDQTPFDFKMYDSTSTLDSPVLDKLAKEGMVFDGAYHMGAWYAAVCAPSRQMVMTGRTVWDLPNWGPHKTSNAPEGAEKETMGAIFGRGGYETMRTSKKGNYCDYANEYFDITHEGRDKRRGNHENGTGWHTDRVIDYLTERETSKEEKPFLVYLGISHPHDTRDGTPELLEKYGAVNHRDTASLPPANPKQPVLPANYLPKHPWDQGHNNLRDEVKVSGVWRNRDEQTIRNELGRENACAENIDIQLGKVLSKLEAMGELDNTYIIYTSDHGIAIGRHGLMGKQNLYEHTWRVPFIVKGPGIAAGKRAEGNIYLLDILPTLCDLADIDIPETVQGKSFVPVLKEEKETVRDVMYGVYAAGRKPGMRCVKKGDWKLIKYDRNNGTVRQTQLFNLKENPHEFLAAHNKSGEMETNLADNPKYADKLAEMEALLLEQMKIHNDPYRLWDQPVASK